MSLRGIALRSLFAVIVLAACGQDPDALTRSGAGGSGAGAEDDDDGDGILEETPTDVPDVPDAGDPDPDPGADAGTNVDAGVKRVPSPVPGKKVTYPYGVKNSRYAAGYHTGEDYAAAVGLDVVAVRSGKIAWSNDNGGAYGKWMGLDADNGRTYVYCHLSNRLLGVGKEVKAGDVIGKVGATGQVTGPHLHFEDHPLGPFKYAQVRKPAW